MTADPTPAARPAPQALTVGRLLVDGLVCLVLPVLLLRPVLPGFEVGFTDLVGAVPAYLTASLIPVTYVLLGLLVARHANAVTLMGAASALLAGALAFVPVSGLAFAVKDSSGSLLLLTVTSVSLLLRRPFAAAMLRVALLPDTPRRAERLEELLATPAMTRATVTATRVLQFKALGVVLANVAVKSQIVTAPFGTVLFNAQLADATSLMIPLAWLASALGYSATTAVLAAGLRRTLGRAVPPWGARFWAAVEPAAPAPLTAERGVRPPAA